ncbi:hypothetical protein CUR178_03752 [Leishmania enriettii]|uniref:Actin-like protein n=1 Tax=Leishmania enriettii TaxID=5663 RepID=A0A836GK66_LEIEN|nr:hypothetical protein CUR178_03752 [Leishmania enriettii]
MDAVESACFIDVGLFTMSIYVSFAADMQKWHIDVPLDAAVTLTTTELLLPGGRHSVAMDDLLNAAVKAGRVATMTHVVVLARSWVHPLFYAYVMRWLRAAIPLCTSVSQLPSALFAAECAGVASALVVQCDGAVLFCTPVLDGVISTSLESVWGGISNSTTVDASLMEDAFSEIGAHLMELVQRDDCDTHLSGNARTGDAGTPHSATLTRAEDLLVAMRKQIKLCQRHELHACLATVVLCGDAATLPAARQCIALLLSASLPDSILTWV